MTPPLLKWAGGKRDLAATIGTEIEVTLRPLPPRARYLEPFLGAGGAYLGFHAAPWMPRHVVLSDVSVPLVGFHRAVRDAPDTLLREVAALPTTRAAEDHDVYARVRAEYNALRDADPAGVSRAARLYWLNRTCFNGLYRENRSGEFNVPRGTAPPPTNLDALQDAVHEVSQALGRAHLLREPFEVAMGLAGAGDVVYLDPPYHGTFTDYSAGGFTASHQEYLAILAREAVARGAAVVASNADSTEIRSWWSGFRFREVQARRSIAANGDRGPAREVLISAP